MSQPILNLLVENAAVLFAENKIFAEDEPILERDTLRWKIGDGVTPYRFLPYFNEVGQKGDKGDMGPQGPKGEDGTSVTILGSFATEGELPGSGEIGQSYLVAGDLYVWTGAEWENVGTIQGPPGADATLNAVLQSISALGTASNRMLYTTAENVFAETVITPLARDLLGDTTEEQMRTRLGGFEPGADVTDTENVTAAGALMDSEVADLTAIKTLQAPDNTTISTFAATVLDDTSAPAMRTTLELGTASIATLTTSQTDTTAGRLTKVGDFGLGADAAPIVSNIDDPTLRAGFYRTVGAAATGTFPTYNGTAVSKAGTLVIARYQNGDTHQWYSPVRNLAGGGRSFFRASNIGDFTTWVETTNPDLGYVTPKMFGAVGDGVADDSAAFQAMFDAVMAITTGWPEIYIPAGVYLIGTRITKTTNSPSDRQNILRVRGAGTSSVLVNGNANGVFSWVTSDRSLKADFSDFTILMAAGGNNGDLLLFQQPPGGLSRTHDVRIRRVEVLPSDIDVDYFNRAVTCIGAYWPTMEDCTFANPYGPGVTTATQHQGTAVLDLGECYGIQLRNIKAWGAARGLSFVALNNPGGEGGSVQDCVFDSTVGVYVSTAGKEPGFTIQRTHVNCASKGFHIIGKKLMQISDCLVYAEEAGAYEDIYLENCEDVTVKNVQFFFGNNALRTNIKVDGDCNRIYLEDNKHLSGGDAMNIAVGATNVFVTNPHYALENDREIIDGSGSVVVRRAKPYRAQWSRAASQSIPNTADVAIIWDTITESHGFPLTPASTITIPDNRGIKRVRVTSNVQWANNSTGGRRVWHTKNGVRVAGITGEEVQTAQELSQCNLTSIIPVTDGDVIRVLVEQTSGGDLNVGGGATWITVEEC